MKATGSLIKLIVEEAILHIFCVCHGFSVAAVSLECLTLNAIPLYSVSCHHLAQVLRNAGSQVKLLIARDEAKDNHLSSPVPSPRGADGAVGVRPILVVLVVYVTFGRDPVHRAASLTLDLRFSYTFTFHVVRSGERGLDTALL